MYAIVEIAGHQYKVEKDQQLFVNRLQGEEGDSVSFDKVLLTDNGTISVGAPVIEGVTVEAKILEHLKGDKIIVFKKKRRKGYKKKNGFRPYLTKIEITAVGDDNSNVKESSKEPTAEESTSKDIISEDKAKESVVESVASNVVDVVTETVDKASKKIEEAAENIIADDLTIIEGIGPKVQELLNENGIFSYSKLASKTAEEVEAILKPKGGRYSSMNPTTWPKQASMAAEGKLEELKAWQDELHGGNSK